jgi:hypothetical protein
MGLLRKKKNVKGDVEDGPEKTRVTQCLARLSGTTYLVTSSSQCAGGTLKTVNSLKIVMINQGEMNLKNGPVDDSSSWTRDSGSDSSEAKIGNLALRSIIR